MTVLTTEPKKPQTYPNVELDVLVHDCLDVESDCGNGRDRLVELELIQDRWIKTAVKKEEKKHDTKINVLVFPAASRPSMRIRISLLPKIFDNILPILRCFPASCAFRAPQKPQKRGDLLLDKHTTDLARKKCDRKTDNSTQHATAHRHTHTSLPCCFFNTSTHIVLYFRWKERGKGKKKDEHGLVAEWAHKRD